MKDLFFIFNFMGKSYIFDKNNNTIFYEKLVAKIVFISIVSDIKLVYCSVVFFFFDW